jgi:acyl-CoA synthetase (AMP-forming)/AMP-acid ligase II
VSESAEDVRGTTSFAPARASTHRPDLLDILAGRHPAEDVALVDDNVTVTYGGLADRVRRVALDLLAAGVEVGDRVAVSLGNRVEAVEVYLACLSLGAIWVGVNPAAPQAERDRQLALVTPRALISDHVGGYDGATMLIDDIGRSRADGSLPERPPLDVPCAIAFTSGTTSVPKAVVHSRAAVSLSASAVGLDRIHSTDRVGIVLPMSIHNLMVVGVGAAMMSGASVFPSQRMNGPAVARACRERRLTMVTALVPATIFDLVHDEAVAPSSLATLRYAGTGAAGLAEELRGAFVAKFGVQLCGSYGMTEAPGPVAMEDVDRGHRPGGSGKALPHIVINTDRDSQFVISAAADGPFADLYRPPLGLWHGSGITPWPHQTLLCTGDYGRVDDDGEVRVESRRTGVIVRGGVNVDVGEIEAVLSEIAGVRGVAVVGVPDDRLGERIVAFIEVADSAAGFFDGAHFAAGARELLSHAKCPDEYVVVDALPRNAMGKVDRTRLARPA